MSGPGLSGGAVVRASNQSLEVGPRPAQNDAGAPSSFPDLLSKMATAANAPPSRPAISFGEHRPAWGREMLQIAGSQDQDESSMPVVEQPLPSDGEASAD